MGGHRKGVGGWLVALVLALSFFAAYPEAVLQPNQLVFGADEDSYKNHFTVAYHVRHDSTFSHFQGMNYPFGEQVMFVDAMPLVSNALKVAKQMGLPADGYTVGVVNLLMLLSLPIGGGLFFSWLRRNGVPWGIAVMGAVLTLWLSPQLIRWGGHYALGLLFVVPAALLLWQRWFEAPTARSRLLGWAYWAVFLLAVSFVHLYYLLMVGCFWLLATWVGVLWHRTSLTRAQAWLRAAAPVVAFLLVYALVQLWISDTVTDRHPAPYGLKTYVATPTSVFFPLDTWLTPLLKPLMPFVYWGFEGEGYNYLGLGTVVALGAAAVWWGRHRFRLRDTPQTPWSIPTSAVIMLLASLIMLVLAMGVPVRFLPEELLDLLGPIRQFRSLGRLAWVPFFVLNGVAFMWLGNRLRMRLSLRARLWLGALALLQTADALYSFYGRSFIEPHASPFRAEAPAMQAFRQAGQLPAVQAAQAFSSLPYQSVGSEYFQFAPDLKSPLITRCYQFGLATGLPGMHSISSRLSVGQTWHQLEAFYAPGSLVKLREALPSRAPILGLHIKGEPQPQYWFGQAVSDLPRVAAHWPTEVEMRKVMPFGAASLPPAFSPVPDTSSQVVVTDTPQTFTLLADSVQAIPYALTAWTYRPYRAVRTNGRRLKLRYLNADGNELRHDDFDSAAEANFRSPTAPDWIRFTHRFTPPPGTKSVLLRVAPYPKGPHKLTAPQVERVSGSR